MWGSGEGARMKVRALWLSSGALRPPVERGERQGRGEDEGEGEVRGGGARAGEGGNWGWGGRAVMGEGGVGER